MSQLVSQHRAPVAQWIEQPVSTRSVGVRILRARRGNSTRLQLCRCSSVRTHGLLVQHRSRLHLPHPGGHRRHPARLGRCGREIPAAVERIPAGDNHAWAAQFTGLADRWPASPPAARPGQHCSARDAFLRASTYYSFALEALQYFTDDNAIRSAFHSHRQCWEAFADLNERRTWNASLSPTKDTEMPGYFLSVDGTKTPHPHPDQR